MKPKSLDKELSTPEFIEEAKILDEHLKKLDQESITNIMKISPNLAKTTQDKIKEWSSEGSKQTSAVDTFVGDIYSGLQVVNWTNSDKEYAQNNLRIISGLYGILKPYDGVKPYRLEMGYPLKFEKYKNLYEFWGKKLAQSLPNDDIIINLSAEEYTKTILSYVDQERVISPRFLTINPKTKEPTFVVVHAKIARGSFANWLIKQKADNQTDLTKFNDLGYRYYKSLSSPNQPVYICESFGGIGLSVRLK